ncbi:MAG TPA: GntR family transcriptional regulator [Anaerolineaceae bacterium]|nr:GntR family transcriptional regulator [Anaerolineaceae bacterium]
MKIIDRRSHLPLYIQLKDILLQELDEGRYPPGSNFPPEMTLVDQYSLSRATVRQAIKDLEHEGYINRIQGKGTIVIREKSSLNRALSQLTSFTEDMKAHGYETTTKILKFEVAPAPYRIAELLHIAEHKPIIHINRLRIVNKIPVAINTSYVNLPESVSMCQEDLERTVSLYTLFEMKRIPLVESDKTIEAISANEEQAKLLGVPMGNPLLKVEGVVFTLLHQPLEHHVVISRSDMYKYSLHLLR